MRKRSESNILKTNALHERKTDPELGDLKDVLNELRQSYYAAAEKPEFFWKKQHDTVIEKMDAPVPAPTSKFRFAYWGALAAAVLLGLFFFVGSGKVPVPDLSAGYDQDLLVEVEQALDRDYPLALKPAALLAEEIEQKSFIK